MPEIHPSHEQEHIDDTLMCPKCHVCVCHSPDEMKEECEYA